MWDVRQSPDLSDHDKLSTEACEAEEEKEAFPLACSAQYARKHVNDGGHHHLHSDKLSTEQTRGNEQISKEKLVPVKIQKERVCVVVRLTCVSRPRRMSMTKKQMDHS